MSVTPRRVVLLGGTFDPVHCGHVSVAEQVRVALDAAEVWLIPVNTPPHRPAAVASALDRLALAQAVAAGSRTMRVLDIELRRPGASYTIDTLEELARAHPDVELWFLLGADAAREIGSWHGARRLLASHRFVLVNREGVPELREDEARRLGFRTALTRVLSVDSPDVSATDIRRRVRDGESLAGLVPDAVAAVMSERGLYRDAPPAVG